MKRQSATSSSPGSLERYLSEINRFPLLTVEETMEALRRAQKVAYRPPGAG